MTILLKRHLHATRKHLWKGRPERSLTISMRSTGGRNNEGIITCRHRGGGVKKRYRLIDFKRRKDNIPAIVERLEYDPNRTAFIALIKYEDGELSYILAPNGLKVGDKVMSGENLSRSVGNTMPISSIPVGTELHNVEFAPGKGGKIARSAGTFVRLCGKEGGFGILQLSSGERRKVTDDCRATIGIVSNEKSRYENYGKAGTSRKYGIRPTVRGIAMNPVDHCMGGRTNSKHPRSPTGKYAKGGFTRSKNKRSNNMIIKRSGSSKYKASVK